MSHLKFFEDLLILHVSASFLKAALRTPTVEIQQSVLLIEKMENFLTQLSASIVQGQTKEDLVRPLLSMLTEITQLESTYLTSIDFEHAIQNVLYARNSKRLQIAEGFSLPLQDSLCQRALSDGCMYTYDVATTWPDAHVALDIGIHTYLSTPVFLSDGSIYGTLCAASEDEVKLPDDVQSVMRMFAKLIAQRIEYENLLQELQKRNAQLAQLVLTDPLTQLPNRTALREHLQQQLQQAQRNQSSFLIAFIDLDGFKLINDQYGHSVGDRLLNVIAQRLKNSLRSGDMVARIGGDEFVWVTQCPALQTESEDLISSLQKRLNAACKCDIELDDMRSLHYPGASIGLVTVDTSSTIDEALQKADAAMYAQKLKNKDCSAHKPS